ncbi:hypothetical protein K469DRAFT_754750, partial [Zopfia rhizophila CBS 207.26]
MLQEFNFPTNAVSQHLPTDQILRLQLCRQLVLSMHRYVFLEICLPSPWTGSLDMNKHFGLNLKAKDGVRFRKKSTCGVLQHEGHYEIGNITTWKRARITRDPIPSEEFISFYYTNTKEL